MMEVSDDFTQVLNSWVINHDLASANQLRSMVYFHLKGMVKKQIENQRSRNSNQIVDYLPNTTSLLHDVLLELSAPDEIFDNRKQFFVSLALFVRWMLLDEIKRRRAKKRSPQHESMTLLSEALNASAYLDFDNIFTDLEPLSQRCYEIALLHFYLGLEVIDISDKIGLSTTTVYNEIASAKAYLRAHCTVH
tara:strand:- start:8253 stop:8828 length:576 start_codon:yes stop_codon:yes gene_type:complete